MKKVLLAFLLVGMVAGPLNAATLGIKWQGTDDQMIGLNPSDSAVVEVWLELPTAQRVINFFGANEPAPASQMGVVAGPPGWIDASTGGPLGGGAQQISVGTPGAVDPISGGLFLVAEQTIHLDSGLESDMVEIAFDHGTIGILDPTGGAYSYAPDFRDLGTYWGYGQYGSPGATSPFGSDPRSPLLIHVLPEPASLVLLALGGLVALRRR